MTFIEFKSFDFRNLDKSVLSFNYCPTLKVKHPLLVNDYKPFISPLGHIILRNEVIISVQHPI